MRPAGVCHGRTVHGGDVGGVMAEDLFALSVANCRGGAVKIDGNVAPGPFEKR